MLVHKNPALLATQQKANSGEARAVAGKELHHKLAEIRGWQRPASLEIILKADSGTAYTGDE